MICMTGSCVEMFYTASENDVDMYDQIYIFKKSKKYILEIGERDWRDSAYDIDSCSEIMPTYVSRTVFDLIVDGLEKKGFKRCFITMEQ